MDGLNDDLVAVPLDDATWPLFAALMERVNGVWGGCWCIGFHAEGFGADAAANRDRKRALVRSGRAQAALMVRGDRCVGWAQFGRADELVRIKSRRAYDATGGGHPDWRVTCFFTEPGNRRAGVADRALQGVVTLIGSQGGGRIEAYPEDVSGRRVSGSFLHGGTTSLFERHGFARDRLIGKHRWVMARTVVAASGG